LLYDKVGYVFLGHRLGTTLYNHTFVLDKDEDTSFVVLTSIAANVRLANFVV
jgi:hypothetical protein